MVAEFKVICSTNTVKILKASKWPVTLCATRSQQARNVPTYKPGPMAGSEPKLPSCPPGFKFCFPLQAGHPFQP